MGAVSLAVSVSLIPFLAVWTALFLPIRFSKTTAATIQAIAAGFLMGSVLIDLTPRILRGGVHFSYIVAFIIGFSFMLFLQREAGDCCGADTKKPLKKFLFPFCVEFFVTALLIGIASTTSAPLLIIIAISFGLCNLVCGLSISSRLTANQVSVGRRAFITLGLTSLFPIVSFLSATLVTHIPREWVHDLLSFAIATLLYLVLDELLPEALEVNKMRALTLLFSAIAFVFLLFLLIQ